MELILNDFSINGQFLSEDDFDDYAAGKLRPLLDMAEKAGSSLYKKSDTYTRKITPDLTFQDYITKTNNPVATVLKSSIINLTYREPYWDVPGSMKTVSGEIYEYPSSPIGEPNCFTEAIERTCPLISFPDSLFLEDIFLCKKSGCEILINNLRNKRDFLDAYLVKNVKEVRFVMEEYPYPKSVLLAEVKNRCFAKEALLESGLTLEDVQKVIKNVFRLIEDKGNGRKSHWWDSIDKDICEYRVSVSGNREFRLFFVWEQKIIFLNGFIKKSASTPEAEKRQAKELLKSIKQNF